MTSTEASTSAPVPAPPLTSVVGRTERALAALLRGTLAGSAVDDADAWVALAVATSDPLPGDLTAAVAAALPAPGAAADALESLRAEGVLDGDGLTAHGREVAAELRARVAERVARLVDGLDEADLAAAVRVLDAVRERAVALAATSR